MSLNRLISSRITRVLAHTPLTPNHVTAAALGTGVAAAIAMAQGSQASFLWGAFFLHISFLLDNCDGELARLKACQTEFGKRFDITADLLVDCAMWIGLAHGAHVIASGWHWYVWACVACLGSVANEGLVVWERKKGCCTSIHAANKVRHERERNPFLRLLDIMSHNGDIVFVVWAMAIWGNVTMLLVAGSIYIHGLWLWRFVSHSKVLLAPQKHAETVSLPR